MVATPIGNLADITFRAVEVLRNVDLIAAEDTRHTKRLLDHYDVRTPCTAYHEHNERQMTPRLIERLVQGQSVALVSDAGTPLISDPGYHLIDAAHDTHAVPIIPIPGPSAVISALSVAGLPNDRFVFEGYLPAKPGARRRRLEEMGAETRTMVFYEAPHRIEAALADMAGAFGAGRRATCARELTKTFETVQRATLEELSARVQTDQDQRRGEFVLLVQGRPTPDKAPDEAHDLMLAVLLRHVPLKTAVVIAAELSGEKKNLLYQRAVALAEDR